MNDNLITSLRVHAQPNAQIEDSTETKIMRAHCSEAADEIERLRNVLVEANNRWRHDFAEDVEIAADKLFKKLAAHRTDPFAHK